MDNFLLTNRSRGRLELVPFKHFFMLIVTVLFSLTQINAQVSVSITKEDPSCNGFTNGSATATASGGTAPYTYLWSTGGSGNSIAGVGSGSYSVIATDATGKTGTASTTINNPSPVSVGVTFANICTSGSVTATGSGGTAPYTYNWGGGITGAAPNLAKGGYNLTVTDTKGCAVTKFVFVPGALGVNLKVGELQCFGDCDAAIDALPINGTAPFTYLWNTGSTTQSIVGIPSGTYSVTITDANGCTASATGTVINPPQINITTTINSPSCGGGANGSATANATGGKAPYTYLWSNGQTTATATGLNVGTYTVTVTDANNCRKEASVNVISSASFTVVVVKTDATCASTNGSATATVTGSSGTLTYKWSTGATTQTINNIGAGTYSVTVTDGSGCSASASATVNAAGALAITVSKTDAACGIANGTATATVTAGTAPFTYKWSNNATTATITLLGAGTYLVTVTDANGCTAIGSATVIQTTSFDINIDSRNVSCAGGNNGQATAMVMGGSAPYTYNWSNGVTTALNVNLAAGTYRVTVTDASGCTSVKSVTITQPSSITATASSTSTSCGTNNSGTATVVASGGTAPYTYLWNNGGTTASISGLAAGSYTVTVTDANFCTATATTAVGGSGSLTVSATGVQSACGTNNGSATATVTGGVAPFTYAWSNGGNTATISNLGVGTYTVTVTDKNGCSGSTSVTSTAASPFALIITANNASCFGNTNGNATALVEGGTAPYSYAWSNGVNSAAITNLAAGTYTVTASDSRGCRVIQSVTITQPARLVATATGGNTSCGATNNGSASVSASGGTAPYTYLWSNGATTANISNLTVGTYTVTVTDSKGCTATSTATVGTSVNLTVTISSIRAACGTNNGSATANVSGGTAPFTYAWSNGGNTATVSNLGVGIYTVTVTDKNNCTGTSSVTITDAPPFALIITANNISCFGNTNGNATAFVEGGTAPYSYAWSNGANTAAITNLAAGTYTVTATDSRGCRIIQSVVIIQPARITLTLSSTPASCGTGGTATATVSGGTPPFTYAWSNSATTASISNVVAGSYSVTVTDLKGCQANGLVTVGSNTSPNLSCSVSIIKQISAINVNDGEIKVNVSNGAAPYQYLWSNGKTTSLLTGLGAGTYTVTVTDNNGCKTTCSINLPASLCDPITNPGMIMGDEDFCPGQYVSPILEGAPASGGSGVIEYLWMYSTSTNVFNPATWRTIEGETGKDLRNIPTITSTSYFIRCVRRKGCNDYDESNVVTKKVKSSAAITRGPFSACVGKEVTFEAGDLGSPTAIYAWYFEGADISYLTSRIAKIKFTSTGIKKVTLEVYNLGCRATVTRNVEVSSCVIGSGLMQNFDLSVVSTHNVKLEWITSEEYLPSKYVIERSSDGKNFVELADVKSQNKMKNLYRYDDVEPKMGRAFYRVKHIHADGDISYSVAKKTVIYINGGDPIMAYPNPVNNQLFIEILDAENTEGVINIYNLSGTLVKTQKFTKEQIRYEIETTDLPIGLYVVKIKQANGTIETLKFNKN